MTTHVYDYDTKTWVPFEPNVNKYKDYFLSMTSGNHVPGQYVVKDNQKGMGSSEPDLKIVSPTAQAVEMAKEEIKNLKRKTLKRKFSDVFDG